MSDTVAAWLDRIGLVKCAGLFDENDVDLDVVRRLSGA